MKLPRAERGEYDQEYCGAIYSLGEGIYYSSKPSHLGERQLSVQSKRMPHSEADSQPGQPRPGELYERRGRSWKLVGYIMPEDKEFGRITPVEENP